MRRPRSDPFLSLLEANGVGSFSHNQSRLTQIIRRHQGSQSKKKERRRLVVAVVCYGVAASHARRINDHNAGTEPRKTGEMRDVERQQVRHPAGVADRHEPGVMHLLADHPQRPDVSLPRRVNVRRIVQERKGRLETRQWPGNRTEGRYCLSAVSRPCGA